VSDEPETRDDQLAVRYARTREWLALLDLAAGMALLLFALVSGVSARLRTAAEGLSIRFPTAVYTALGTTALSLISLPLSFYSGYVVERRFDLSNQSVASWFADWVKGMVLGSVLAAGFAQGASWVMRRWPKRWWAVLSAMLVPVSVLMVNLVPVLILPLFNKFETIADRELEDRIKRLAADQGVAVSQVMSMNMSKQTKKANAFFTGVGNTRRIVVGDTMLEAFTPDEIEVVLAHELGHQVHRDIWKLIALQMPLTLGSFYAMQRLAPALLHRFGGGWRVRGADGVRDPAALPLLALVGSGFTVVTTPLVNAVIRRLVEHRADVYSLELTRNPTAFIGAMQKLGRMNLADPDPPSLIKWLFHNHPTIRERIELARRFERAE
jgi:STE24 endopeptidase